MILASDFSGILWEILSAVLGFVFFCVAAGAVTAGLIRQFAKRRRFGVLVSICVIGWAAVLGMGWMLYQEWLQVPIPAERAMVEAIKSKGGSVVLNVRHEVVGVRLHMPQVTDSDLQTLVALHNLQSLDLSGSSVTDDGLQHLSTLTQLTVLNLSGTRVTDAGLENLHGLESLANLWLRQTNVTDDARLGLMVRLTKLRMLDQMTSSQNSTGAGLNLHGAKASEAGFRLLAQMDELVDLNLAQTSITDDDLELLASLKLISLDLRHTTVTDAGLLRLEALTSLQYLHLEETQVTQDGVERLAEKLPRCAVFPR
ncbi:MAG: hypothetical protein O3C40_08365 [Planctomycetota bacterium]|nr:hypothetical protein [Planctomycetota bacterium]